MELIQISFFFMILTGIYLATKKHFLIPFNEKYNNFLVRMCFTIPASVGLVFIISIVPYILFFVLFKRIIPDEYIFSGTIILTGLFFIFLLHKYYFRNDLPPEHDPDFMKHELYVFMPFQKAVRTKYNRFSVPPKINYKKDFVVVTQLEDLKLNYKSFQNKDLIFTEGGEIIVSEKALLLFSEKGFNDLFGTRPAKAIKGINQNLYDLGEPYFQLLPKCDMPPLDSKTNIIKVYSGFSLRHYAADDKFYYNRKVMENVSDFNRTFEALGAYDASPYLPQKLWIVTNKAMECLLTDFSQNKRDFIPIMLVDDETDN